jgi:membrane-associated phospholipid phosphatase
MNLTDRIYFAVHATLTLLVFMRRERVAHWPVYVAWNLAAMVAIWLLARKQRDGVGWEFAHDWLPAAVFFTSVFEEVSFLSLALVPHWQSWRIIAFESALFGTSPVFWLRQNVPRWALELLEFGYFAFYPMYPIVGLTFWVRRDRPEYRGVFRRMTDALAVGYVICYATYLLWPTQSPRHALGIAPPEAHGLFRRLVGLIQGNAGVHGNAFPSGHIMLAFVVLVFVWRYPPFEPTQAKTGLGWGTLAPWLPLLINLLMCLGAVYDGYHYASDAVAGAALGFIVGLWFLRKKKAPADAKA